MCVNDKTMLDLERIKHAVDICSEYGIKVLNTSTGFHYAPSIMIDTGNVVPEFLKGLEADRRNAGELDIVSVILNDVEWMMFMTPLVPRVKRETL